MRKYLTSLLILAAAILLPDEIFADEQVRRVQEELRKRHLFYADANGEKSAALSVALKRYQEKKGFSPTGSIDSVTLVSLGISTATPLAATTPSAVGKDGEVRGANGETLPSYPPFLRPNDESVGRLDPAIIGRDYFDLQLPGFGRQGVPQRRTFGKRLPLTSSAAERGAFSEATSNRTSEGTLYAISNPGWSTLVLQPAIEMPDGLGALDDPETREAVVRSDRRPNRRQRRAGRRKETNPFVLTYHSVDRALRSLFGEPQTKKKRSTAKRL
jgi:hypothetical protein